MASTAQNALPLQSQRLEIFSHQPYQTQDEFERAKDKARQLLREILPEQAWWELENEGVIKITGKRAEYVISPLSQTEIRDLSTHQHIANACLQLSITAPNYDRVVAEYLLIKEAEAVYWKTANISNRSGNESRTATLLMIVFDIVLFMYVLLTVLTAN